MSKAQPELRVEKIGIDELHGYEGNAKKHTSEQLDAVENSIGEFGFVNPVLAWHNDEGDAEIVAGHARTEAARKLGLKELPVVFLDHLSDAQRRALTLADNQTTMMTGWDETQLAEELAKLSDEFDMGDFGFDVSISEALDALEGERRKETLAERFGIAPFSVLNARSGEWVARKQSWLVLGIRSELGRDAAPSGGGVAFEQDKSQWGRRLCFNIDARASAYREG